MKESEWATTVERVRELMGSRLKPLDLERAFELSVMSMDDTDYKANIDDVNVLTKACAKLMILIDQQDNELAKETLRFMYLAFAISLGEAALQYSRVIANVE